MRILYLTLEDLSLHKGSVVHIKEIISGLRNRGHRVGLIGRATKGTEDLSSFQNIHREVPFLARIPFAKKHSYLFSSLRLFFTVFKILPQYDIIYARDYHTVILAFFPRIIHKKKLVFEINGLANEEQRLKGESVLNRLLVRLIRLAEKVAARWCDRIVSVTPYMASHLVLHYGCNPEKIRVISNGVNTRHFYPISNGKGLLEWHRRKLGIGKDDCVITFVGNLNPSQGVEDLIEVAPFLLKERDKIKFLIVGDGILKDQLNGRTHQLGVGGHFVFSGMVDYREIPVFINLSDICVLFKRKLGSGWAPIKVYEYMACGKPIVSSRVDGLGFIEEEGIGMLAEPGNLGQIKEALDKLIEEPEKRKVMGEKGLRLAREKFDWEFKAAEIEEVLLELA